MGPVLVQFCSLLRLRNRGAVLQYSVASKHNFCLMRAGKLDIVIIHAIIYNFQRSPHDRCHCQCSMSARASGRSNAFLSSNELFMTLQSDVFHGQWLSDAEGSCELWYFLLLRL